MLPFTIKAVYDVKYSVTVGYTTQQCMDDKKVLNITIRNIKDINWDEFDTLVLGHMDELSALLDKKDLKEIIIKEALDKGKQVFSFDDLSEYVDRNSNKIYFPIINQNNVPPNILGMLYHITKPIVGVFGTSSRQGKFTLQLKLREILVKQGYKVGQIGTEPSSLLFGFDYCYPMGYNSSVYIHEYDVVRYINHIINKLCVQDFEIILVGSQSGTIPFNTDNILQFTIPQQIFLTATQPDCVVLCVNPFDEISYIRRTILYIESSIDTKVISIVVFPMDISANQYGLFQGKTKLGRENYNKIKKIFEYEFHVPVFNLDDEAGMEELVEEITDFFS